MNTLIKSLAAAAFLFGTSAVAEVAPGKAGFHTDTMQTVVDKRGKKRIPGGSGCDDPRDIIEHPECAG